MAKSQGQGATAKIAPPSVGPAEAAEATVKALMPSARPSRALGYTDR